MHYRSLFAALTLASLVTFPVVAQENDAAVATAQTGVKLTGIEEELRRMRGKIEENEFQMRRMAETMEKLQRDTDFRLNEMAAAVAAKSEAKPATAEPAKKAEPAPAPAKKETAAPAPEPEKKAEHAAAPAGETTAGDGMLKLPKKESETGDKFATPRDLYNHAFRLLNETRYDDAAAAFSSFAKKYPKDPLVGNAYYWQGETYYIQRDYVTAADNFRQGFEVLPDGPKAPDNLLKLAMSLDALDRAKEACVVLQQITTKFKRVSTSVTDKAAQEQKRIGCGGKP